MLGIVAISERDHSDKTRICQQGIELRSQNNTDVLRAAQVVHYSMKLKVLKFIMRK
jgi:hypothetical protein